MASELRQLSTEEALRLYEAHKELFASAWESVHTERKVAPPPYASPDGEIFVATFLVFRARYERGEARSVWCSPN